MSSLQTIPFDIFHAISRFFDAEDLCQLLKTMNKRIHLILAIPGLVDQLDFNQPNIHTDWSVLYLLRTLKRIKALTLAQESYFSMKQLLVLSQSSNLDILLIKNRLVDYPLDLLLKMWSKQKSELIGTEKLPISSLSKTNWIMPNFGVLFPNLRQLQVSDGIMTHIPVSESGTKKPTNQHLHTLFANMPPRLKNFYFHSSLRVYDLDNAFSYYDKQAGSRLRSLKIEWDLPIPAELSRLSAPFPNLKSLEFGMLAVSDLLLPSTQHLPPTLEHLILRPLSEEHIPRILDGRWVKFKELSRLETLVLYFVQGRLNPQRYNGSKIDLNATMPHSLTGLCIQFGTNTVDTLESTIQALPLRLRRLTLHSTDVSVPCGPLLPLVRNLPNLRHFQEISGGAPDFEWTHLPNSLVHLESNSVAFKLPISFVEAMLEGTESLTREISGTLASESEPLNNGSENSVLVHSNGFGRANGTSNGEEHEGTVSGLKRLSLPSLSFVPQTLQIAKLMIQCASLALAFTARCPQCELHLVRPLCLDGPFVRILLDEYRFAEDGHFNIFHLHRAVSKMLGPKVTNVSLILNLTPLGSVLNLLPWSYVNTLILGCTKEMLKPSSEIHFDMRARELNFLPRLQHITCLNMINESPSVFLPSLSYLPPKLTRLNLVERRERDQFGPTQNRETMRANNLLLYEQVDSAPFQQIVSLNVQGGSVFSFAALRHILSPHATQICCTIESTDTELASLPSEYPRASFELRASVFISGAFVPLGTRVLTWDHVKSHTANALLEMFVPQLHKLTIDSLNIGSNFQSPNDVEVIRFGDQDNSILLRDHLGPRPIKFHPLPPSVKSFTLNSPCILWENVGQAILNSPSLVSIELKTGRRPADVQIEGATEQETIHLKATYLDLQSLSWTCSEHLTVELDLVAPKLKALSLIGLTLTHDSLKTAIPALVSLETFTCDSAMTDTQLFEVFRGHPSLHTLVWKSHLLLTGGLLPTHLTELNWDTLTTHTFLALKEVARNIELPAWVLNEPLTLPPSLLTENSTIKSVVLTVEALNEIQTKSTNFLQVELPLTKYLLHTPLSLTSLSLSSSSSNLEAKLDINDVLSILTPLKSLVRAEVWSPDIIFPREKVRIGRYLPTSLTSLRLPTLVFNRRTGYPALDPPPSLTEFFAPELSIDTKLAIPATLKKLVVKNSKQLRFQ